uniref:Uncharacterized protein n=1 Tax=Arundo donax TaxID=35708 RepID=A0A0A8YE24_ARUDO
MELVNDNCYTALLSTVSTAALATSA